MKKLLTLLIASVMATSVLAEAEMKEVCHDKVDKAGNPVKGKDGKIAQECKTIKVHKKLEGEEAVPTKK